MATTYSSGPLPSWNILPLEKDIEALEAYLQNCEIDYSYFRGRKFLYQKQSLSLEQRRKSLYLSVKLLAF